MENTALLVIDVQRGLFTKSTPIFEAEKLLENIMCLIDGAHRAGIPVFFIQHSSDKILCEGTEEWCLHPQTQPTAVDYRLQKHHPNAFEGTSLKVDLDRLGVQRLVVTGLVTHGCVKATCIGAHQLGYKVTLVKDGHSNYSGKAKQLIEEWNQRLSLGIVELKTTQEIDFSLMQA
jgi:nicotinamidase-related amidase